MMRYQDFEEENLYKQYANLGKKIARYASCKHNQIWSIERIWELIAKEGIWELSIQNKNHTDLNWNKYTIALVGLASTYPNLELISLLINHISIIYLILYYGTERHKKQYLSRLIQGKFACLLISQSVKKKSYHECQLNNYRNKILNIENVEIIIHANSVDNKIEFDIHDKKSNFIYTKKMNGYQFFDKDKFISAEKGITALGDIVNFERLLYGFLAAHFALSILGEVKKILRQCTIPLTDQIIQRVYKETGDNLRMSQQVFYSSLQH